MRFFKQLIKLRQTPSGGEQFQPIALESHELRVIGWPHSSRRMNPYIDLLYASLREHNVKVEEAKLSTIVRKHDILHIHWPEYLISGRGRLMSLYRSVGFLALVRFAQLRGSRVVWTVHDVTPHKREPTPIARLARRRFIASTDGLIYLSESSRIRLINSIESTQDKPCIVSRHGHYRDAYSFAVSKREARANLAIPYDAFVYLFFGTIRQNKLVGDLISAFKLLSEGDSILIIAGRPSSPSIAREITDAVVGNSRIKSILRFIEEGELINLLAASDIFVHPARSYSNSGSVVLALSSCTPTLTSSIPEIMELRELVGSQWIQVAEDGITASELNLARDAVSSIEEGHCPDLGALDWSRVGTETSQFFKKIAKAT